MPWIRDELAMNLTFRLDGHFWDDFSCWFECVSGKNQKSEWRQCHESAMKPTWIWHIAKDETEIKKKNKSTTKTNFLDYFVSMDMANCTQVRLGCESAMKLPWNYHENAMTLPWFWFWGWKKVPWIRDDVAMNLTCRFHVGLAGSYE